MMKFYAHYDHETGKVIGFNQNNDNGLGLEITREEYMSFVSGEKRMHEYTVAYGENSDGDDVLMLMFNVSSRQTVNNVRLRWVSNTVTESTALVIKWDLEKMQWRFSMTAAGRESPSAATSPSVFYIVDKDNIDYMIRAISVAYADLENGEYCVPFATEKEQNFEQLMIAAKSRFKNFGMEKI